MNTAGLLDDALGNKAQIRQLLDERFPLVVELGTTDAATRAMARKLGDVQAKTDAIKRQIDSGGKVANAIGRARAARLGRRLQKAMTAGEKRERRRDAIVKRIFEIDVELWGYERAVAKLLEVTK